VSIRAAALRRGGEKTIPGRSRATIEEDAMNPNLTWAIAAERMQTQQADAGAARRARHAARARRAARARQAGRSRRGLALAPAR
jgi:hypothetical protein